MLLCPAIRTPLFYLALEGGSISGDDDGSDGGGDDGDDHDHEDQVVSYVMRICPSGRIRGNCSSPINRVDT